MGLITRPRLAPALVAGAAAAAGAIAWNAILHSTRSEDFFVDAPIAVFPASWQDTGSGVFALAATALASGLGPERRSTAAAAARLVIVAGVVAFLVDIYLY